MNPIPCWPVDDRHRVTIRRWFTIPTAALHEADDVGFWASALWWPGMGQHDDGAEKK